MIKKIGLPVVLVIFFASVCGGIDWPGFRGINRDGKSCETGLLKKWPDTGPKLLWSVEGLGKGLKSRWYAKTLQRRILDLEYVQSKIQFIQGDGLEVIRSNIGRKKAAFFIDPPYTKAGRRLYKYHEIEHEKLFDLAQNIKGSFIMTYDETPEIEALALRHRFEVERVLMKTTHHLQKYEFVIGRDLQWLREMSP